MTPIFPDCYDEWGLYKITYDGDHKMYEMLFEGTEESAVNMLMTTTQTRSKLTCA
jgi:hypothetical protein